MDGPQHRDGIQTPDAIDLQDEYQVRQWTEIFDITVQQLTDAVRAAGHELPQVKRYVREQNLPSASDLQRAPARTTQNQARQLAELNGEYDKCFGCGIPDEVLEGETPNAEIIKTVQSALASGEAVDDWATMPLLSLLKEDAKSR